MLNKIKGLALKWTIWHSMLHSHINKDLEMCWRTLKCPVLLSPKEDASESLSYTKAKFCLSTSSSNKLWRALIKSGHLICESSITPGRNYFWNSRTATLHVQFFPVLPLQRRRQAWLSLWHHPASLSWYRNVMDYTEKNKWLLSSLFSGASDEGIKTRAVHNLKNIRKPEDISFNFALIFYTFSEGFFQGLLPDKA